jgi:hypothetical protein
MAICCRWPVSACWWRSVRGSSEPGCLQSSGNVCFAPGRDSRIAATRLKRSDPSCIKLVRIKVPSGFFSLGRRDLQSSSRAMIVRIIYRPSHPQLAATRGAVYGRGASLEEKIAVRESKAPAKPLPRSQRVALRSLALFLVRMGLGSLGMAAWRIASDLGLPIPFVITGGVFSHWQVWFSAAVLLVGSAGLVARRLQFGRAQDDAKSGREQAA